ncbi:ORF1 [Insect tombusbipa-like virus 1]|uniref:Putative methyltransferase domain n=1 Tax=Thrips tabaci associated tombusbipa-like virus 1 TaxID=2771484 RepID=A0A7H1D362_9VIRU|nr:ORF1 [Insect tombusbipa-like virus 1]QNS31066.1 putative methyltransferase domain [Thrips tabaci associated tombusbipa-like virus 1]
MQHVENMHASLQILVHRLSSGVSRCFSHLSVAFSMPTAKAKDVCGSLRGCFETVSETGVVVSRGVVQWWENHKFMVQGPYYSARFCYTHRGKIFVATSIVIGVSYWYWRSRHMCVVVVENRDDCMWNVADIKDHFEISIDPSTFSPSLPGLHLRIAEERRRIEGVIFEMYRQMSVRARDIGGARSRHGQYADIIHKCNPTIDSSDILRVAKAPRSPFHSCTNKGQDCQFKDVFPGAVFIHSDYYLTPAQIAACIRSHTFICTHGFKGESGIIHGDMHWEKKDGIITATTADGGSYSHAYNLWENEGCIVGRKGAAVYARVYHDPTSDTAVYYAYPAAGLYRSDDRNVLRRSTDVIKDRILLESGKSYIRRYACYSIQDPHTNDEWDIPADCVGRIVSRCATSPRDDKFPAVVASAITTQLTSREIDIIYPEDLTEMVIAECDRYVVECHSRYQRFEVNNMGMTGRVKYYGRTWLKQARLFWKLPMSVERLLSWGSIGRVLTPWAFSRIVMPCYVRNIPARRVDVSNLRPNVRPFRNVGRIFDAELDDSERRGPGDMPGEPHCEHRDESSGVQVDPEPVPNVHEGTQQHRTHGSDVDAILGTSSDDAGEPGDSVSEDELAISSSGSSEYEECSNTWFGDNSKERLHIICDPSTGTNVQSDILLVSRDGENVGLFVQALDQIEYLSPEDRGCLTNQVIFNSHLQLQRAAQEHPECFRTALQNIIRLYHRSQGHSAPAPGERVFSTPRDVMAVRRSRAARIRDVAQALPATSEGTTEERPGRSGEPGPDATRRSRKEFRKNGNNGQIRRSKEHQSQRGRVSRGRGAVRGSNRGRRQKSPVSRQGVVSTC